MANNQKIRSPSNSPPRMRERSRSPPPPPLPVPMDDWDHFDFDPNILRGIYSMGFEKPSIIQQKAIPPMMQKRDVIAQAQSGTGKTAAFSIGALSIIDTSESSSQVLILSPTKELATQTAGVISSIGKMLRPPLQVATLFGGCSHGATESVFAPHVICGCPGKVFDWMRRGRLKMESMQLIVLDEADEMLSSGFNEQVHNIISQLPSKAKIALFSATLPPSIQGTLQKLMRNPVSITVKSEKLSLDGISQYYLPVDSDQHKYELLKSFFSYLTVSQSIIYCNSVDRVKELHFAMKNDQFPVSMMHSNMDREEREEAFLEFKCGKSRVLISSNVTARGIDVQQVSIVINFDVPKDICTYLHRIGRSGRWGRKGTAINLVTKEDVPKMKEIERIYALDMKHLVNIADLA